MSASGKTYVLVTAAYNEERNIGRTIESIIHQTRLPARWVIVSDGSSDRTDEIVQEYAKMHPFIRLYRVQEKHAHNFGAQVHAIHRGIEQLEGLEYDFIANLDADLTFEPTYYEQLLRKFDENPSLGMAGGFIYDPDEHGNFLSRPMNGEHSVAHAVQMLRRECYRATGGWVALPYGGPDWHLQVAVQMHGWRIKAFRDLPAYHHRPTGSAQRPFRNLFREGRMDYALGSYPPFEMLKVARRYRARPIFLSSLVRLSGFFWGYCIGDKRPVTKEFVRYLRSSQKQALRNFFRHGSLNGVAPEAEPNRSELARPGEIRSGKPRVGNTA